jgi:hypothetical protein
LGRRRGTHYVKAALRAAFGASDGCLVIKNWVACGFGSVGWLSTAELDREREPLVEK